MKKALAVLAVLPALAAWADVAPGRVFHLHYTPQDRESGRYQYVPVEVPAGTTRLTISYAYDRANGENVVDLGLFEPGPLDLGRARARGWSGGERSTVTVATGSATPGYWPGTLPPGRWHVQLGLYKVAPAGVDVELTVETSRDPQPAPPAIPPLPKGALRRGPAWYKGDLHTHTVHSDGKLTVAELARAARQAGLDFIAITDHNNTAHQVDAWPEDTLLHIVGEEVTTPGGHANVWGLGPHGFIDFRVLPGDPRIESLVKAAANQGALFSVNHPFLPCSQCSWAHAIPVGVAGIEIWNGPDGPQEAAIALWDKLLRSGRRITGIGSSDFHRLPQPLARGSVRVWAKELSTAAILEGIREGRVIVMGDATSHTPQFAVRAEGTTATIGEVLLLGPSGAFQVEVGAPGLLGGRADIYWNGEKVDAAPLRGEDAVVFSRTAADDGYVRAQLHAADGTTFAITNPVFIKTEGPPRGGRAYHAGESWSKVVQ